MTNMEIAKRRIWVAVLSDGTFVGGFPTLRDAQHWGEVMAEAQEMETGTLHTIRVYECDMAQTVGYVAVDPAVDPLVGRVDPSAPRAHEAFIRAMRIKHSGAVAELQKARDAKREKSDPDEKSLELSLDRLLGGNKKGSA